MEHEYVTFTLAGQMFGARVSEIRYVYAPSEITIVPMAPPEIAGILNLRGRIVTAINVWARLGLPGKTQGQDSEVLKGVMAIGVERDNGESYALLVDQVGEVITLSEESIEANPINLNPVWAEVSKGVHRMKEGLIIITDMDRILMNNQREEAA